MNPADLPRAVVRAVRCAVADGELAAGAVVPERVVVERTRPGGVGDYATPVAFQVAKRAGAPPHAVAQVLARRLAQEPDIEDVEVTGPGFLCFVLPAPTAPDVISRGIIDDIVIRDARGGAAFLPPADAADPSLELRERIVRDCVLRLLRTQAARAAREDVGALAVAAVARRDGDVIARYGRDAAAWAMLAVPAKETPAFSDVLLLQSEASELFRVRYAHVRARDLVRNAAQLGFGPEAGDVDDAGALLRALADQPLVLEAAAHHRAPERVVRHLVELADALLDFQYRVLPKGDEKPSAAHRARLALAEAAGTVLAGGLALLGIDAPDCL
ncbi:ArgS-related anticodon-binding protein NrtL [Streptomyces goshikiensis]|uniref:ArgS-related anticodon-binding protein NrtL n=1 Tax=Streptomyces goshikiensis TaxID=1942 RepID=UPI0037D0D49C